MQSLHETRKRILELVEPIEAIEVPLSEAVGLVLAEPHFADVDLPSFDRSTLGGYALRSADASPGRSLRLLDDPKLVPPPPAATVPMSRRSGPADPDTGGREIEFGFGFEPDLDFAGLYDEDAHLFSQFDEDDDDPGDGAGRDRNRA